jgi:hypothetical protein
VAVTSVEELRALIRSHGLTAAEERIMNLVRPCVRLRRTPVDQDSLSPSDSRLGGDPHLPIGFEWPFRKRLPLAHIATIRLSDAAPFDTSGLLPPSGLLYFWYDVAEQPWGFDPKDAGGLRVDYVADENAPLVRTPTPVDRIDPSADRGFLDDTPRAACRVGFERGLTLPNWEWLREHRAADSDLADSDAYGELAFSLTKEPRNYLLGHPHLLRRRIRARRSAPRGTRGGRARLATPSPSRYG